MGSHASSLPALEGYRKQNTERLILREVLYISTNIYPWCVCSNTRTEIGSVSPSLYSLPVPTPHIPSIPNASLTPLPLPLPPLPLPPLPFPLLPYLPMPSPTRHSPPHHSLYSPQLEHCKLPAEPPSLEWMPQNTGPTLSCLGPGKPPLGTAHPQ